MKQGRIALRNKLIRFINNSWQDQFGAFVIPGDNMFRRDANEDLRKNFHRLIIGANRDGKGIFIYPQTHMRIGVNATIRAFLQKMAARGAIVGVAYDSGDAWDILEGLKRKRRTYSYQKAVKAKPKKNAESLEESGAISPYRGETVEES